jgi:hypothetical protein
MSAFADLRKRLAAAPKTLALAVAQRAAPALTQLTRSAYAAGRSVYGEARPRGVNGEVLALRRTGRVESEVAFVREGTIVRCQMAPPYARYLVRYGILPNAKAAMPASWTRELDRLVNETRLP